MPAALDSGLYEPGRVEATYEEMFRRARLTLEQGVSVVLDATWRNERMRAAARSVADSTCSELIELRCASPMKVLEARLASRGLNDALGSDATVDILGGMRFEEWVGAREIDTNVDSERSLAVAMEITAPEERTWQPVAAA